MTVVAFRPALDLKKASARTPRALTGYGLAAAFSVVVWATLGAAVLQLIGG